MPRLKKSETKTIENEVIDKGTISEIKEEIKKESKEEEKSSPPVFKLDGLQPTPRDISKAKLSKLIAEETKLVKGRFRNYEAPGGNLRVQIRKYPNIPSFDMVMEDNKTYQIPLYVARHLNGVDKSAGGCDGRIHTCAWPTHGFSWEPNRGAPGNTETDGGIPVPIIGVEKWNRRFGFESLEFDTET